MGFGFIGNIVFQLVLAAIGGIIGGSLTLLANRSNAKREQIKFAQEWYERQYLMEGIEPLTAYYTVLERILRIRSNEDYALESLPESTAFPVMAYNRLRELFPDNRFTLTVAFIEADFRDGLLRIGADLRKQIHTKVHDKNAHLDSLPASQIFAELFEKKGPLKMREFLEERSNI